MKDLSGARFGKLTAIELDGEKTKLTGLAYWVCKCDCGATKTIRASHLKSGATSSCGCIRKDKTLSKATRIPESKSPEYRSWSGMHTRCKNPLAKNFKNYGGRGIKVCDRWESYGAFLSDMGRRPGPKYSLDRIDNNGDYAPENCKWSTPIEQSSNKRNNHFIEHDGLRLTLAEWSRRTGINAATIWTRLVFGESPEYALKRDKPRRKWIPGSRY